MSEQKIEAFWENATADDVAGIIKTGELVPARFRDSGADNWEEYSLAGWKFRRSGARWIDSDGVTWNYCQVYREPSWFTNKPDPGPGYRLLGKFPDEELKLGDELWFREDELWGVSNNAHHGMTQGPACWYRRRIEPVEPVKAISMSDFEAICNGELVMGYAYKLPNGQTITITEKGFEVTQ